MKLVRREIQIAKKCIILKKARSIELNNAQHLVGKTEMSEKEG